MIYLLDTNICVHYLNGTSPPVMRRIRAQPQQDVVLCSIVIGELLFGAAKSNFPDRTSNRVMNFTKPFVSLPFNDAAAAEYAQLRAYLERKGALIGPNDLMIAGIALANSLILATHNTREFSRVPHLLIEDWELP